MFCIVFFGLLAGNAFVGFSGTSSLNISQQDESNNWRAELDEFQVIGKKSGYMNAGSYLQFLDQVDAAATLEDKGFIARFFVDPLAFKAEFGLLPVLLLIIFGGLALNLTPCVLPMIPINLAIIGAGTQMENRVRGFALGGAYGGGITLAYGVLGAAAVMTGTRFGAIQSTWWFNLLVAAVFIVLGLAMFDVIRIDLTAYQSRFKTNGSGPRSAFSVAATMGAVSAMLAGACVAPVVIAVLLLAPGMGSAGFLLPFLLGLGMALPWPFAGAGLSFLPKPGKWMVTVKYALGVVIFIFAIPYMYLAYNALNPKSIGSVRAVESELYKIVGSEDAQKFTDILHWARLRKQQVIIDFHADWCKNCKKLESTTLKNSVVADRLKEYLFIKFRCDNTKHPFTRDVMDYFSLKGIPTIAVLYPIDNNS